MIAALALPCLAPFFVTRADGTSSVEPCVYIAVLNLASGLREHHLCLPKRISLDGIAAELYRHGNFLLSFLHNLDPDSVCAMIAVKSR